MAAGGTTTPESRARSAAMLYAVGAAAWIIVSDLVFAVLDISSPIFNIIKGFGFVTITTLLLWRVFLRHEHQVALIITDVELAGEQLKAALEGVTRTVGLMVEARDPYTAGHNQRVGDLACLIGCHLGLDDKRLEGLRIGGYLHDVGKVLVDEEILNFPGQLSDTQRDEVQQHCQFGHDILRGVPFNWPIIQIIYQHHERLDGSGYPQGLRGDEIMLEARIVAIADVFDALTSERPYRAAEGVAVALRTLSDGAGSQYDSEAVQAIVHLVQTNMYTA